MTRISNKLLLLFLLAFLIECQKLSVEENQERLLKCGKEMPHQSSENLSSFLPQNNSWLARVTIVGDQGRLPHFTMGSFISPRHILTSSQVVMNHEKKWIWNEVEIQKVNLQKDTNNTFVPIETMGDLKLRAYIRGGKARATVLKAWLIQVDLDEIDSMRSLMLIELNISRPEIKFPCLVGENAVVNLSDTVHIFGQNPNRSFSVVDHRVMEVKSLSDDARWIKVDKYEVKLDRGGPMVEYKDDKVTVLGVAASPPVAVDKESETHFFDMRKVAKDICELAGVCEASLVAPEDAANNKTFPTTKRTGTGPRVPATTVSEVYDEDGYDDYPDLSRIEDSYEENGHQSTELYFVVSIVLVLIFVLI